jgi:hypothetical protein
VIHKKAIIIKLKPLNRRIPCFVASGKTDYIPIKIPREVQKYKKNAPFREPR